MASSGDGPTCHIESQNDLPKPLLSMFFQGYLLFSQKTGNVLEDSIMYRAIILDAGEGIEKLRGGPKGRERLMDGETDLDELQKSVRNAHVVWSFIEAVYLSDEVDDGHLSLRLAAWYVDCFPEIIVLADRMEEEEVTVDEKGFWELLTSLVAAGQVDRALKLVRRRATTGQQWADAAGAAALGVLPNMKSGHRDSPLGVAEAVLGSCPWKQNAARRDGRWEHWQKRCMDWSESEEMAGYEGMRRFLRVLGGNEKEAARASRDWAHMLVACVSYGRDQTESGANLSLACGAATGSFSAPMDIGGGALIEAALGNAAGAVINLGSCMSTPWFAAHLCELLVRNRVFPADGPDEWTADAGRGALGMREYYLNEFARSLERYRGMWRIAAAYYLECETVGKKRLAGMLGRTTFDGTADANIEKVLRLCEQGGWESTARLVCERIGAECLQNERYGAALMWFARGEAAERAHEVAEEAMRRAEMEGPGSDGAEKLESVVIALSAQKDDALLQALDYLHVYMGFQQALAECRSNELGRDEFVARRNGAIQAILRLIRGGGLARKHWAVALVELAPFVTTDLPAVPLAMMQELMAALEVVSGRFGAKELMEGLRRKVFFEISQSTDIAELDATVSKHDVAKRVDHTRKTFVKAVGHAVFS